MRCEDAERKRSRFGTALAARQQLHDLRVVPTANVGETSCATSGALHACAPQVVCAVFRLAPRAYRPVVLFAHLLHVHTTYTSRQHSIAQRVVRMICVSRCEIHRARRTGVTRQQPFLDVAEYWHGDAREHGGIVVLVLEKLARIRAETLLCNI
jgi:hypothetical protein